MHFDDRLATVLRHRASGERAARTQFRQLLDLLGRRRHGRDENLMATAWLRLGALGEAIPANDRAAMIRAPGWRFQNPELAAHFAEDEPAVAAAALGTATLSESDWEALIPRLPIRARGFLRLRNDLPQGAVRLLERLGVSDRALPLPQADEPYVLDQSIEVGHEPVEDAASLATAQVSPIAANTPPQPANDSDSQGLPAVEGTPIAALVERIEAFQRNRAANKASSATPDPRLPFEDIEDAEATAGEDGFIFSADIQGQVDWAEDHVASLVQFLDLKEVLAPAAIHAMRRRQPLVNAAVILDGAPALAGEWVLDASPRFSQPDGRFYGYAGRLRRKMADNRRYAEDTGSDRIRQLLHELRTPVNAIQGFSEVIQQQLFGPVPHEYRALAASIAGDSARMLAGFDELDRLAKLESGERELDAGQSDFSAIIGAQIAQLQTILRPRNAGFAPKLADGCITGMAENDAEKLSWRILAALAASLAPGESGRISLMREDGTATLDCQLPAAMAIEDDIFAAKSPKQSGGGMLSAGSFGSGFALRLARAEARSQDGELARVDDRLVLTLPLLTTAGANLSQDDSSQSARRPAAS
ncbi:sensor histidine kinase [Parerythrobacter jejuensis]|uniref:histidine kinase n=1 Tax=Parerythrobacter jejuensis TaxID=795812 RepID=A0A845AQK2_9SPHN|nr:HAMP domain-containing histidine kinase [Parerythrobacter jejuensis]MXP31894.1 sensor histidine kinase [Parerythrobacter jejuensis]